ncbi:MAG: dihydropteroate synthase [Bordetella sp.]|nr:MAG: dihydropteroate synthase [Bordetella sp.]
MMHIFQCGRFELNFKRPLIMGIVNITPDSFSDGGLYETADLAIAHAFKLIHEGADILDLGGESTRPGFTPVSEDKEKKRLLPVIEALYNQNIPLSVDTSKPEVMRSVLDSGVDMINDVYGFTKTGAMEAVSSSKCGLCIMHIKHQLSKIRFHNELDLLELFNEIKNFLENQKRHLLMSGIHMNRMVFDPGFGFGKTPNQNYFLLKKISDLKRFCFPLMVGLSRKSMIGAATGKKVSDRLYGSLSAALTCVSKGVEILRVHDVAATVDALRVWKSAQQGYVFYESK